MEQRHDSVSVTQLTRYISELIGGDMFLSQVCVEGELSNVKLHSSGHIYFTLKDDESRISCVMFRSAAGSLRFLPEDGTKVTLWGRVGVYEKSGSYQIYVSAMRKAGAGDLYERYRELLKQLGDAGWFDESRKKPLPYLPRRIALVTSPTGAAVRDMISVLTRRAPYASLIVCPVLVQGADAASSIASMLSRVESLDLADLILLGRGGGSIEDLWAFNEIETVSAVYRCAIPVISCVGHETDFTITDFVADMRAPTPSAAAEMAAPDIRELRENILGIGERMNALVSGRIDALAGRVSQIRDLPVMKSAESMVDVRLMRVDELSEKLDERMLSLLEKLSLRVGSAGDLIRSYSLEDTLKRGFFVPMKDGEAVGSGSIRPGDQLTFGGWDASVDVHVDNVKGGLYGN
ncbi:MAG: exodeoxyribonuclease VII large subunit [Eubacteriaceae bacterium]|nr:exodeoxyribonuclease VII large subunit [Eubacteriaceae bacterium]